MQINISNVPMDDTSTSVYRNFLEVSAHQLSTLKDTMDKFEKATNSYCVCSAEIDSRGKLAIHIMYEQLLKLARMYSCNIDIQSHYSHGHEAQKPWPEHLFCLSFEYFGITYFTLMDGEQIDRAGIEIPDKDALMKGGE